MNKSHALHLYYNLKYCLKLDNLYTLLLKNTCLILGLVTLTYLFRIICNIHFLTPKHIF